MIENISLIITIVSIVAHIIFKISDSMNRGSNDSHSYSDPDYLSNYELNEQEKLENMNIDDLIVCYQSTAIIGFSVEKAQQMLLNNYNKNDIFIKYVVVRKNCIYLKVLYAMPFEDKDKCYSGSFSINYMLPNNSVSVYGFRQINSNEDQVFKEIAKELIAVVS